jgi:uncharacterized repeat protein (TIGR01451 family)
MTTTWGSRGARGRRRAGRIATLAVLALAALLAPPTGASDAAAATCGYGTGGPYASNLCWFDMSGYRDVLARSLTGQPMSVTLPGGYTVSFTLTSRPVPGAPNYPGVESRAVPLEARFAFGTVGYVRVPGRPALYSFDPGTNGVALTLSDIQVVDAAGVPVTGYSFVVADVENNIRGESFTWTSDKPLELIGVLNPTSARGCHNALTGLGTTTVRCTGQGTDPTPNGYDDVLVGADTPSTIGLSLQTFARSGVAFAIMTSKIEVTKSVAGRIRASDSFDVAAISPEGSTIASASTGGGNAATTGELTVLPRADGASYLLSEASTLGTGTLQSDYAQSWACTNNGAPDPALPAGPGTSVSVTPQPGDDIACTVTNTQQPAHLSIAKSASPSPAVPGTDETYTLVVSNAGPSRATNVRVTDPLPSGLSFVSASAGCGEAGGTVACTTDSLEAGASQAFTVTARVASSVEGCAGFANTATVTSDTPDPDAADDAASVCPQLEGRTDLSIDKTPSLATLPVGGGQVMYTLVVENDGPSDATGVTVSDPLPPGLTLEAASASQGSCSTAGGAVSCALGKLAQGGSAQVLVTARTWGTPGAIVNTASVTGDQVETDPGDNGDSATVAVPLAPPAPPADPPTPAPDPAPPAAPAPTYDLVVAKRANDRDAVIGQPVRYTIVVANRGAAPAPDVTLRDTLSAPVHVASVRTTAGSCSRGIPMRCSLGTIAAGRRVTARVVARHVRASCGQRNAASATAAGAADAQPGDNLDAVAMCARRIPLRVTKIADRRAVAAGALVSGQ